MFHNEKAENKLTVRPVFEPLGHLEHLSTLPDDGVITIDLPHDVQKFIISETGLPLKASLHICQTNFYKILNAVRNIILDWALELEKRGIMGENLTFTSEEKQRANQVVYNIHSISGGVVGGNVTGDTIQIGSYNSICQQLKKHGISQEDRNELKDIMDSLPKSPSSEKKTLIQRGLDWVGRNKDALGTLGTLITDWFHKHQ